MENEVRLNIKLPESLLEAVKQKVKEKENGLTVSSVTRLLLTNYVNSDDLLNKYTAVTAESKTQYHEIAQRKRELKLAISKTHDEYLQARYLRQNESGVTRITSSYDIELARKAWKQTIAEYKKFCSECSANKNKII